MKRFLFVVLAVACLGTNGCTLPGEWWPFGGLGGAYTSNTADEATNYKR